MNPAPSTGSEIVLGLAGAIGTAAAPVAEHLETGLARAGFSSSTIAVQVEDADQLDRTVLRGDARGALAIARIKQLRGELGLDPFRAPTRHAYIVRSLERPDEVELLRSVYGRAFLLVAAAAPGGAGIDSHAQADVFLDAAERATLEQEIERFLEILLEHPFRTPRIDEYGMALARIAALRSASLSRQVGAAILDRSGAVRALGTNEVPCSGGGAYWEGDVRDTRDFHLERDAATEYRERDLADLLRRLAAVGWLDSSKRRAVEEDLSSTVREALTHPQIAGARIMESLEYGRAIHAESAAISAAAAAGIPITGCTLYSTAFPCHHCARPIVASGIARVVYLQPYPSSLVKSFFSDSIAVEEAAAGRVAWEPFVGVSPERYAEFFRPSVPRQREGRPVVWDPTRERPRIAGDPRSYLAREDEVVAQLQRQLSASGEQSAAGGRGAVDTRLRDVDVSVGDIPPKT